MRRGECTPCNPHNSISQPLGTQQVPLEWATAIGAMVDGPFPLENVTFVPVPPATPELCDLPGMLPLPKKTLKRQCGERERATHSFYPDLLFRLGHSHLESQIFLLTHRLQCLAQNSSTDPQI